MNFASDNWAGASEPIMQALAQHNEGYAPAYGSDDVTNKIKTHFCDLFERQCEVWFTGTGTAANALAASSVTGPGAVLFSHEEAHIRVDECGAAEFMQPGCRIWGLEGDLGKIQPSTLSDSLIQFPEGVARFGTPQLLTLTQATEVGTVYEPDEIKALSEVAKSRNMPVHMDGARFANALVSLDISPAEMTWKSGVDMLSFGATKNGAWCAEAVIFFDTDLSRDFEARRLRAGHHFSKMRFIAAQFDGYFKDDHWLDNARHANAMASYLASSLTANPATGLGWEPQANEVFALIPKHSAEKARKAGAFFHEWPSSSLPSGKQPASDETLIRLVCSFRTTKPEIDAFLESL